MRKRAPELDTCKKYPEHHAGWVGCKAAAAVVFLLINTLVSTWSIETQRGVVSSGVLLLGKEQKGTSVKHVARISAKNKLLVVGEVLPFKALMAWQSTLVSIVY